jgi:hypothetical protein
LALGPGLGINIAFGLALIGTLVFLTRELQRYNNNRGNPTPPIPVFSYTEQNREKLTTRKLMGSSETQSLRSWKAMDV